ncbi:MAG: winged helix DNA-binding protein [Dehalococcoidales bacterium]|nr:winged helix DNA-binding protein [Dehalococcoidales bacterium]
MDNKEPEEYMYGDLSLDNPFDFWVLLSRTQYAISRLRELELTPYGLSTAQAQVLNTIYNAGGETTLTLISKYTMRQHHSVSNLIIKMAEQGLVKKVRLTGSKEYKIAMTKKGHELYNKDSKKSIDEIFSTLSEEDKQHLAEYLKVLLVKARNLLGIDYIPPYLSHFPEER